MTLHKHRVVSPFWRASMLLLVTSPMASCLDLTPGPPTAAARITPDAGNAFESSACYRCVTSTDSTGQGCGKQKAACDELEECKNGIACLVAGGMDCYGSSNLLGICSATCGEKVGFKGGDDPSVIPALAYVQCVMGSCSAACFGAAGPDAGAAR